MLALSIMQPWAHLIVSGQKDIENRTWRTDYRGPFLIHAGKRIDCNFDARDFSPLDLTVPNILDLGGIVGEAEIVDCVSSHPSPWFFGLWGFVICNARPLPFRPCRGQLGFFRPDYIVPAPRATPAPRQGSLLP